MEDGKLTIVYHFLSEYPYIVLITFLEYTFKHINIFIVC